MPRHRTGCYADQHAYTPIRIGACVGAPIHQWVMFLKVPPGLDCRNFIGGLTLGVPVSATWSVRMEPQFVRYETRSIRP
ncbi:MAG: hypothetical protein IPM83_15615 [Ignavibacteria bacterium]|nr:hypothetical protein [Ignavibacteria bacterium]